MLLIVLITLNPESCCRNISFVMGNVTIEEKREWITKRHLKQKTRREKRWNSYSLHSKVRLNHHEQIPAIVEQLYVAFCIDFP